MKVPPSRNANLYVAAVDSSTLAVVKLGYIRGLVILEDTVTTVKTHDINWVSPGWRILGEDSLVQGDANTPFRIEVGADKNKPWEPLLIIEVTDPFHINERKSYHELLIGLNGYGNVAQENPSGWRRMEIHRCPEDDRPCRFAPALTAPAFGIPLPEQWSVYTIYPEGEININWQ